MGSIKSIIEAIEARMVALGFKATEEVFDFDSVPDSIIDKGFRIETRNLTNPYYSGNIANPKEEISVWIAYAAERKIRAAWKEALDDREEIENDLINAASITGLSCDPILRQDQEASATKYLRNYLISKVAFTADYIQDISPA